jgi:hypothetical protein
MASICCSPPDSVPPAWPRRRKEREHLIQQTLPLLLGDAVAVEAGAQILHDRQQTEDAAVFRHVADAQPRQFMRRQSGNGVAIEQHGAVAWLHQAHDGL